MTSLKRTKEEQMLETMTTVLEIVACQAHNLTCDSYNWIDGVKCDFCDCYLKQVREVLAQVRAPINNVPKGET